MTGDQDVDRSYSPPGARQTLPAFSSRSPVLCLGYCSLALSVLRLRDSARSTVYVVSVLAQLQPAQRYLPKIAGLQKKGQLSSVDLARGLPLWCQHHRGESHMKPAEIANREGSFQS